ncbi:MAG: hypothetical protein PHE78_08610 [Candidatus Gastranaerophilales bacterium]|nr:hypothetical protein [Candidatus Gastranaerophilales bacterium]
MPKAFAFNDFGIVSSVVKPAVNDYIDSQYQKTLPPAERTNTYSLGSKNGPSFKIQGPLFPSDLNPTKPLPPPDKDYMLKNLPVKPAKYNYDQAEAYNQKLLAQLQTNFRKHDLIKREIRKNPDGSTYIYTTSSGEDSWRINSEFYKRYIDTNQFLEPY